MWCWGSNRHSELGLSGTTATAVPMQVGTDSDWLSHNMQVLYATPEEAMDDLEAMQVKYLVVDESPALQSEPYVDLANRIAERSSSRLEKIAYYGAAQGASHSISVYQLKYLAKGPPKKIRVNLKYSPGRRPG